MPLSVARRYARLSPRIATRILSASRTLHTSGPLRNGGRTEEAPEKPQQPQNESRTSQISRALREASSTETNLLAPVHIPEDPLGVLNERHPATTILSNSALVVTREMEMMNVMLGYEEANKYAILDAQGNHVGYMAEQDRGMGRMMMRQMLRTHRSFTTHIFDRDMKEILRFHRPFSYINSTISVYDPLGGDSPSHRSKHYTPSTSNEQIPPSSTQMIPQESEYSLSDMRLIGETKQIWAPLRRKYDLFLARPPEPEEPSLVVEQFARVDEPFLSWDFALRGSEGDLIGSVSRNFTNLGRELFTDAGVYALRMDAATAPEDAPTKEQAQSGKSPVLGTTNAMTLDQRAVMLATAVTIDYDYFSRERGGMFGGMPFLFPMGGWGGGAAAGEAGAAGAAGAAGEAGAIGGAAAGTEVVGTAAGGLARGAAGGVSGAGEGAMAGAGTMAAYEAMQQSRQGHGQDTNADGSPVAQDDPYAFPKEADSADVPEERPWWEQDQAQQREQDSWGFGDENQNDGGGEGDSDWGDWF